MEPGNEQPEAGRRYYPEESQMQNQNQSAVYLTDLGVKLRDIEEKQNIIKDRLILIGENLVAEKQETEQEVIKLKTQVRNIEDSLKRIELALRRLIENQENFARESEMEILKRQMKMFQPLEFARMSDVEEMIKKSKG